MLEDFQKNGKYLMLALDHRGSFKKFVNKDSPDSATDADITRVKKMIIDSCYDDMSGILIDPDWGLPAYKGKDKPYLLCIEKTGYVETEGERNNELMYSADELRKLGASGIKMLLYFNPDGDNCESQIDVAREALRQSADADLPFFLEPITYGKEAEIDRSTAVIRSVQMILDGGVRPDVFKLQYPGSPEACAKISEILNKAEIPWILLTGGENFDLFRERIRIAASYGAVGFLAGRAIWQEIADCPDDESRLKFLSEVSKKRFKEVCEIAEGQ